MMMKFYAVRKGRQVGIFTNWNECQKQISGYSGAEYKSFKTRNEAQQFLNNKDYFVSSQKSKQASKNDFWKEPQILLFTDGGSRNHGNHQGQHVKTTDKAAWAFYIRRSGHSVRGTGGEYGATNNRMELMALVNALKVLGQRGWNREKINATLDSKYVLQTIQKGWLNSWKRNDWKKSNGEQPANLELWQKLDQLLPYFPRLKFGWTKGHADNRGNVLVDKLLNQTMDQMENH